MDRRIESLRPEAQAACNKWLHICHDDLGLDVRVLETLRDENRQREVEAAGKSAVKFGWHNVGLAWDFGVFVNGVYLTNNDSGKYTQAGIIGEQLDCIWGGRWVHLRDFGHLEFHPGFTLQQFLNGKKDGLVA